MTEYEKELKLREVYVGDQFILQGDIYNTVSTEERDCCKGCSFHNTENKHCCCLVPSCGNNDVIYIKEVDGD